MNFGLTPLLNTIFSWPTQAQKKKRPARSGRRLLAEQLETRYALAGDVTSSDPPPADPGADLNPPADVSPPPTDPNAQNPDPNTQNPDPNPSGDPIPPNGTNAPPVISGFTFTRDGNFVTIQGTVTDDQNPVGYMVDIWGILSVQVSVDQNDRFSWVFEIPQEYSGEMFAQTHDMYGMLSNTASISI